MAGTGGPQKRPIVQWRAGTVTTVTRRQKRPRTRRRTSWHFRTPIMSLTPKQQLTCAAAMDVVRMAGTGGQQRRPIVQWRAGTVTTVASLFEGFLGKNHKCSPSLLNLILELSVDLRSCFDERFAG